MTRDIHEVLKQAEEIVERIDKKKRHKGWFKEMDLSKFKNLNNTVKKLDGEKQ